MRELRQSLGLSQRELGVAIRLDDAVAAIRINQYENGVHTPIFSLVQQLAAFAGIPESYFYTTDDELAKLISDFGRLNLAGRRKLLRLSAGLRGETEAPSTG